MKTKVLEGQAVVHAASGVKELAGHFVVVGPDDRQIVEALGYAVLQGFTKTDGTLDLAFNSKLGQDIHPTSRDKAEELVGLVEEAKALAKRAPTL